MKTAVSVPDDLFERVDRLARAAGRSRSEVYSAALREYVERHSPDEVTRAWDRVIEQLGPSASDDGDFAARAARRILEDSGW